MVFSPHNNGVEKANDSDGSGQCCVPLIADGTVDSQRLLKGEISNRDQHDMKADDDEGSDGDIDDYRGFETIENLATIQHTKEK